MSFEIVKIKPLMTHEQRVYEYARRISHYSLVASAERAESKKFACSMLELNKQICGEFVGCAKRDSKLMDIERLTCNFTFKSDHPVCPSCAKASEHYGRFRDVVSKKAAALRQLNHEMSK